MKIMLLADPLAIVFYEVGEIHILISYFVYQKSFVKYIMLSIRL